MRYLIAAVLIVTACGGSDAPSSPTPVIPFLQPITSDAVDILEPFDTTTGDYQQNNIYSAADVPAGDTLFRWESVEGADSYVLLLQDVDNPAGAEAGESYHFTSYAEFTVMQPETPMRIESL